MQELGSQFIVNLPVVKKKELISILEFRVSLSAGETVSKLKCEKKSQNFPGAAPSPHLLTPCCFSENQLFVNASLRLNFF